MWWFSGRWLREKIENDKDYQGAVKFAQTYEPDGKTNYLWVNAHSVAEYNRLERLSEHLDSKAHNLIGYLGAGTGLIAFVFTYIGSNQSTWGAFHVFPVLGLMILAIICAAGARAPESLPIPLSTVDAFEYADAYDDMVAQASFAAMTNAATIGLKIACEEKGRLILWSFRFFVFAAIWLAGIPIVRFFYC